MAEATPKQSIDDKLTKALEYKDLGNKLYKERNFKSAAGKYHRAILYMKVTQLNPKSKSSILWIFLF